MAPNISKRKHIKWGDEPAHEDTTTIVLTSSKGFYVDIRLLLDPPTSTSDPLQKLQWGFAGTAESKTNPDGSRHTTWEHFVDNKSTEPEKDAGDMWAQEDGDTLEKGAMAHPVTGEITPYEELWTDLDIEGPFEELDEESKVCVVMKLDDPLYQAKGLLVRIGGRIQGVVRVGSKFDICVWNYDLNYDEWIQTERLAKASPLAAASELFHVRDKENWSDRLTLLGQVEVAPDPQVLCAPYRYSWKVVESEFWN